MKNLWVLVADGAGARLLEQTSDGERLRELREESLPRAVDTEYSDRPGRTHESHGAVRHGMQPHTDLATQKEQRFAAELGHYLASAAHAGRFGRLIVAAPPSLLGHLRPHLSKEVQDRLLGTLDKELMRLSVHELEEHLGAHARFGPRAGD